MHCEDVSLEAIADTVGTPVYVYSTATFERHFSVFTDAFKDQNTLIAYSVKANSNIAVLATLAKLGAGADVVSGGELARALTAGIPGNKIVFTGVGKKPSEMRAALRINAISAFDLINRCQLTNAVASTRSASGISAPRTACAFAE